VADLAYATAVFVAIRRLRDRPVPVPLSFCGRLAIATGVSLGVGVAALGLPDAVTTTVAALVFTGLAVALRTVPPDVYSALRLRRAS
jgi:hypothetical protein